MHSSRPYFPSLPTLVTEPVRGAWKEQAPKELCLVDSFWLTFCTKGCLWHPTMVGGLGCLLILRRLGDKYRPPDEARVRTSAYIYIYNYTDSIYTHTYIYIYIV